MHVRLADEAYYIGSSQPSDSYLSIENVLRAAVQSGAQAIHPGYGFLSENADFAAAVRDAGMVFIGPPAQAIRAMGDKAAARKLMQQRGVPIVPGYQDSDEDAALARAADRIGYPILVKAAAGGGGKAMRVVSSPAELGEALGAARREAQNAFGDQRLILEKYISQARHIEFQILADTHGNAVHLFERECSVQRRHQKIIEETPSPLLDPQLRAEMGAAAVAAARAVDYENAGTVEFIVDPGTRDFYFLEMNTRLQVEHPITEVTTGVDLVQLQIRIAAGEPIPFAQQDLTQRGHAIECRVYAEDPANHFLPATGCLLKVVEPQRPGLRVDSGFGTGDQVTVYYDPLISKVIAYGETRAIALRRMQVALREYALLGVQTNIEFLVSVLEHPEFQAGRVTTTFVERELAGWKPAAKSVRPEALIAAALSEMETAMRTTVPAAASDNDPFNPWERGGYPRRLTERPESGGTGNGSGSGKKRALR